MTGRGTMLQVAEGWTPKGGHRRVDSEGAESGSFATLESNLRVQASDLHVCVRINKYILSRYARESEMSHDVSTLSTLSTLATLPIAEGVA